MKRRGWALTAVLALGAVAGAALASHRLDAASSTLSRGGSGWLAARLYLAGRGAAPVMLDRPLVEAPAGAGTWVVAFPWQSRAFEIDDAAVLAHLAGGGDLVLAYAADLVPSPAEKAMLGALDVDTVPVQTRTAALAPWRWRAAAAKPWQLRLAPRWSAPRSSAPRGSTADEVRAPGGDAPMLQLRPPRWLPELPRDGALLLGPDDRVVAAAWRLRRGRVVVLPAELLANARLREPGHGALLESLRGWLGAPWRFDEYHHGLGRTDARAAAPANGRGLDLLLLQLLLVYAMAALALSRRLGPAWRESAPLAGSAGSFLLRLGALHHRLRHHAEGAVLLLRRAAELDRRLRLEPGLRAVAERDDAASLVEVGQAVARLQRH